MHTGIGMEYAVQALQPGGMLGQLLQRGDQSARFEFCRIVAMRHAAGHGSRLVDQLDDALRRCRFR